MKKLISIMLIITLCNINFINIKAQEKTLLDYSKNEIIAMSDEEYLDLYGKYYIDALEKRKTDTEIKNDLSKLGIEFSKPEKISTRSISSDIDLNVTFSRRSGQSYTYVSAVATSTTTLVLPGTEDCMSIEWEPAKGSYYSYSDTQNTTLKDYSKRNNGILVFNVQDIKMTKKGDYALASALIKFNNNSNKGSIGIKYIHTYNSTAPTLTIGANLAYSLGLVSGGLSIGLTVSYNNSVWQRAALFN